MAEKPVQGNLLGGEIKPHLLEEFRQFGGDWKFYLDVFSPAECVAYFDALIEGIPWRQEVIQFYGKTVNLPRLTSWHGDPGCAYSYSGVKSEPEKWTTELLEIRERVSELSGAEFNSVLLNLYRNGEDGVSWHADNEAELGECPVIASVSFGAARDFHLRHNEYKQNEIPIMKYPLSAGSVLTMQGETQKHWQHQVPKRSVTKYPDARINLTFRFIHL